MKRFSGFILSVFIFLIISCEDTASNKAVVDSAILLIESESFNEAIELLNTIKKSSSFYDESQKYKSLADSLNKEKIKRLKEERDLANLLQELSATARMLSDNRNFYHYKGNIKNLYKEIELFDDWRKLINNGLKSNNSEAVELANELMVKVKRVQEREFPLIRQEYIRIAAQLKWEDDIEVYAYGEQNQRIQFAGGLFAANRNKKKFNDNFQEELIMFRFESATYRWYRGDTDPTKFMLYTGFDTDLVFINN